MKKLLIALLVLLPAISNAQEFKVVSSAVSIRQLPMGKLEKTLDNGEIGSLENIYSFWGKTDNGWVNLDYTSFNFPTFTETGKLPLKFILLTSPRNIDNLNLDENDVIYVAREKGGRAACIFRNKIFVIPVSNFNVESTTFSIVVVNRKVTLSDGINSVELKPGTALLKGNGGFVFQNHFYNSLEPEENFTADVDTDSILKEVNRLIDIFNSAKLSSPLADRLGYYVKTLSVRDSDLKLVKTEDGGVGITINLRYKFFLKDGKPITGRKTRLFLKKSNYEFWRRLTEELFKSGINKFVDIQIYRFNGENTFENCGFVDSSYHLYKSGKLENWKDFLDASESSLSDDLWFFADQVYERLEDD